MRALLSPDCALVCALLLLLFPLRARKVTRNGIDETAEATSSTHGISSDSEYWFPILAVRVPTLTIAS